jgi:two-component system cell cycle sensor histidine kinase/response regulator CckA
MRVKSKLETIKDLEQVQENTEIMQNGRALDGNMDDTSVQPDSLRELAETALAKQEEISYDFAENVSDVLYSIDTNGVIAYISPSISKIGGYDPSELVGRHFRDYVFRGDIARIIGRFKEVLTGKLRASEYRLIKKSGELCWVHMYSKPIVKDGRIMGVHGAFTDITDYKVAEEAFRESEERFRTLFEDAMDGMLLAEVDTKRLNLANKRMCQMLGYSEAEFLNLTMEEIHPKEQLPFVKDQFEKQARGKKSIAIDIPMKRKDGSVFYADVNSSPIRLSGRSYLMGIFRDTTERKAAEEALRSEQAKAQEYLDLAAVIFLALDKHGNITLLNRRACEILGQAERDLLGKNWFDNCLPKKICDDVRHVFYQLMNGDTEPVEYFENPIVTRDGKERLIAWRNTVIRDCSGNISGILSSGEDITERRQAEKALANSEQFLANIFESIQDGLSILDSDLCIQKVNNTANQWNKERIPLEGKKCYEAYHNRKKPCDPCPTRRSFQSGEAEHEIVSGPPGSSKEWVELRSHPIRDVESNEIVGAVEIVHDITGQKQTEEAIHDSEERFRTMAELLPETIFETDEAGKIVFANRVALERFGYAHEDLENVDYLEIIAPEERARAGENAAKIIKGEQLGIGQYTALRKDGSTFPITIHSSPIIKDGKPVGLRGVIVDVTECKQAEKLQNAVYRISQAVNETRSLDDLYRAVHRIIQDVMQAKYFYISLYDRNRNELDFPYFIDANDDSPGTRPFANGMTEYVIRQSEPLLCDAEIREQLRRKGQAEFIGDIPAVWLGIPLKIEQETIGVMAVQHYTDPEAYGEKELQMLEYVSAQVAKAIERKMSEEALRESESKYRSIVDNSLEGVYLFQDYIIKFSNPKFAQMFGFKKPEAALGRHIKDLVSPQSWELVEQEVKARESGLKQVAHYNFTARRVDGSEFEVEVLGSRIMYRGKPAIQGCMRDISDQRQLEEQLRHAQKMEAVGRLAGGVAHDFNNLLMAISGHTDMALMSVNGREQLHGDLIEIQNATKRAADVTTQLLAFSRKQTLMPKILDLNIVIMRMDKMLRRIISEDIEFSTVPGRDLWNVKVDPGQLEQVVANLVVNACDAMPRGGKLTIETKNVRVNADYAQKYQGIEAGDYVMMKVSDTGIGMAETVRSRIFEPFFTTKEPGKGTGLGLSTVYGIINQSGGHITVESKDGKGSTFRVFLPREFGEADAIIPTSKASDMPKGNETVLVVEDEDAVRTLTVRALAKLGYDVIHSSNGRDAYEMCQKIEKPVDLVITDLIMPGMNGIEFVRRVRKIYPTVKIMFMSGYSADTAFQDGTVDPNIPYLRKPFRLFELAQHVREVLNGK